MDEQEGTAARRGAEPGEARGAEVDRGSGPAGGELSVKARGDAAEGAVEMTVGWKAWKPFFRGIDTNQVLVKVFQPSHRRYRDSYIPTAPNPILSYEHGDISYWGLDMRFFLSLTDHIGYSNQS